jgi:hypothetical protein
MTDSPLRSPEIRRDALRFYRNPVLSATPAVAEHPVIVGWIECRFEIRIELVSEYFYFYFFRRSELLRRSGQLAAVLADVLATQEDGWLPFIVIS